MYNVDSFNYQHKQQQGIDNYADYAAADFGNIINYDIFPTSLQHQLASFSPLCKQFEDKS